ncbi:MAG: hypothetical protein ACT4P5_23770, partial [Armatimonadota bacterium]
MAMWGSWTRLTVVILVTVLTLVSMTQGQPRAPLTRAELKNQLKTAIAPPTREEVLRFSARRRGVSGPVILGPPSVIGPNTQVSKNQDPGDSLRSGASEATLAGNEGGNRLVAGWNDAEGFAFAPFGPPPALGLSGYGFSTNGGTTWTDAGAPPIG